MKRLMASLVLSSFLAAAAHADFVTHPLVGHASAMLSGSESFTGAAAGGGTLDVVVDYAVFAPGQFAAAGGVFNPFAGFGAAAASEYIYAYQIYNVGVAHGGLSNANLSSLNIQFGPVGTISSLGYDTAFDAGTNATIAFNFSPTASYLFFAPPLAVDSYSAILLLSSAQAPTLQAISSVIDGGNAINGFLPAPIPSPAAAVLGLIGLGMIGARRRA